MKQRLVEVFNRDWTEETAPILEKKIEDKTIVEAAGKSYSSVGGTYYEVPVWRLDKKNLNNRVYTSSLAKKLIKENKVTVALKDHPNADEDGSVDRIVAIGKNPHIRDGVLYADCYFVDDDFRKKVENILEHGGNIGLSSSGDGSVDDDGYVLDEDYVLQRYFDFVLTPSYEVYLTKESVKSSLTNICLGPLFNKTITNETVFESVSTNKETANKDSDHTPLEEAKVTKSEEKKMKTSIEEKNFKMGLESRYEKYHVTDKPSEKLKILESIVEYCEGVEFAQTEYAKALEEMAQVKEALIDLAEKGTVVDELEESVQTSLIAQSELQEELETLTQQYNTALEMLESFKVREKKLKELVELAKAERAGMAKASELKEMSVYIDSIEKQMKALKKENTYLKKENNSLLEKFKKTLTVKQRHELALAKLSENEGGIVDGDDEEVDFESDSEQTIKVKDADVTIEDADDVEVIQDTEYTKDVVDDTLDLGNDDEIEEYYDDLVRQNPNVRRIEKQIKKCKTLFEAQRVFLSLEDLIDGTPRQSTNKSNLLESGVYKKAVRAVQPKFHDGWF